MKEVFDKEYQWHDEEDTVGQKFENKRRNWFKEGKLGRFLRAKWDFQRYWWTQDHPREKYQKHRILK